MPEQNWTPAEDGSVGSAPPYSTTYWKIDMSMTICISDTGCGERINLSEGLVSDSHKFSGTGTRHC